MSSGFWKPFVGSMLKALEGDDGGSRILELLSRPEKRIFH